MESCSSKASSSDGDLASEEEQFTLKSHSYYYGEKVFARWLDRWHPSTIIGNGESKFLVRWMDGRQNFVKPDHIISAKLALRRNVTINVVEPYQNDYVNLRLMEQEDETGDLFRTEGKQGIENLVMFRDMTIDTVTMEICRRKRDDLPSLPRWMRQYHDVFFTDTHLFLSHHVFVITEPPAASNPVDRSRLEEIISRLGGIVAQTIPELYAAENKQLRFLLASQPCKTPKYIQALAANIPCLSMKWIVDMNRRGSYMDYAGYRLPAGRATERNGQLEKLFSWYPRRTLLNNLRVGLIGDSDFVEMWKITLAAGLAEPSVFPTDYYTGNDILRYDVILSQGPVSVYLICLAKTEDVPVVNTNWVVNSLIIGRKLPFDNFLPAILPTRYLESAEMKNDHSDRSPKRKRSRS